MIPAVPPRLDSSPRPRQSLSPLWALGLIALALIAAHVVELWQVPLPACTTRVLTGLPCPFCGSTRTLMAAARGDVAAAARLNPLAFLGLVALAGWSVIWVVELVTGRRWTETVARRWRRLRWGWVVAAALVANWVYLWRTLP